MRWIPGIVVSVCAGLFLTSGCGSERSPEPSVPPEITEAVAVIHPTEGNTAKGIVRFSRCGDRMSIVADIEGLKPDSRHGFHIHEFGDSSSPDAWSAGGHYNPEARKHGSPLDSDRHAGDLGNLETNVEGRAYYEITVDDISVNGQKNPILGRGVVVHEGADDLKSQSTGNAGARIGFGVIGVAKTSHIEP